MSLPAHAGVGGVLADPYLTLALAAHATGFLALQRAFARGGVIASVAPLTAAMNLLPIGAGVLVLGDALPSAPLLVALRVAAFAAAAGGAVMLAANGDSPTERSASVPAAFGPTLATGT